MSTGRFRNEAYNCGMDEKGKNILLYASPDGALKLEVSIDGETVWLSQKQMAELFDCSVFNINVHLKNVYKEGELVESRTIEESSIVQKEGGRTVSRSTMFYNLDAIISVGYRINSIRGTQFRIWATKKLKEYIVKGFVLDDERLAQGKKSDYFDELLERIRGIRASERNFYQKITDIYATSVDYNKNIEDTRKFFAGVQNKIHYAVHGKTAAEIIDSRADAKKKYMGLTNFKGKLIKQSDISIAKNYLNEKELKQLNLITTLYLDFAELQASNERPMTMKEWVSKLDDFLKLSEKKVLKGVGTMSKSVADKKAHAEFEKYRKEKDKKYASDFDRQMRKYVKK